MTDSPDIIRCIHHLRAGGGAEVAVHHHVPAHIPCRGIGTVTLSCSPDIPAPEDRPGGIIRGEQDISGHELLRGNEGHKTRSLVVRHALKHYRALVDIAFRCLRGVVPYHLHIFRLDAEVRIGAGDLGAIALRPCECARHSVTHDLCVEGIGRGCFGNDICVCSTVDAEIRRCCICCIDFQIVVCQTVGVPGKETSFRSSLGFRYNIFIAVYDCLDGECPAFMSRGNEHLPRGQAAGHRTLAAGQSNSIGCLCRSDFPCLEADGRAGSERDGLCCLITAEYQLVHNGRPCSCNPYFEDGEKVGEGQRHHLVLLSFQGECHALRLGIHEVKGGELSLRKGRVEFLFGRKGHRHSLDIHVIACRIRIVGIECMGTLGLSDDLAGIDGRERGCLPCGSVLIAVIGCRSRTIHFAEHPYPVLLGP